MKNTTQFPVSTLRSIRLADIPKESQDLAELLGMDAFLALIQLCGGQYLYLPTLGTIQRGERNRNIRARFNGGNHRALAVEFGLSERQIRKIVAPRQQRTSAAQRK